MKRRKKATESCTLYELEDLIGISRDASKRRDPSARAPSLFSAASRFSLLFFGHSGT